MKKILIVLLIIMTNLVYGITYVDSLETKLPNISGKHKYEVLRALTIINRKINVAKSLRFAIKQVQVANDLNISSYKMDANFNLGVSYFVNEQYDIAREVFLKQLAKYQKSDSKIKIAEVYIIIGDIYFAQRKLGKAENSYFEALSIYENSKMQNDIAVCFQKLGEVAFANENEEDGKIYISNAITILRENNEMNKLTNVYQTYSQYFLEKKNYRQALYYCRIANKEFEKNVLIDKLIEGKVFESELLILDNQKDDAKSELIRMNKLLINLKDDRNRLKILQSLVELHIGTDSDIARKCLGEIIQIISLLPNDDVVFDEYEKISEYYGKLGYYQLSEKYFRLYISKRDAINVEEIATLKTIIAELNLANSNVENEFYEKMVSLNKRDKYLKSMLLIAAIIFVALMILLMKKMK